LRRVSLPAPLHLGPALAGYRQLSFADRLRAVRTALALRRLDPADERLDGSSFGEWLARHGASAPATEALWNLVCLPTVNLPAGEASLQLAAKVFRTGMLDTPGGGDLGWSWVPLSDLHAGPAAAALARKGAVISTGVRATEVRSTGDRPSVVAAGEAVEADAVIVAVPHHEVGALLPPASFDGQEHVAELGRSPIVNVHLVYDRRVVEEPLTAAIGSPVQFVFDRTKASGVAGNRQCLAISLSAADEYLGWSPRALVERFTAEMARVFPRAAGAQVVTSMVTREVAATFRGAPGSGRLRPGPSTDLRGVFLAGAWTDTGWPATMEGAVRSGRAAASAAIEHLRTHRPERQGAAV
jgi:squalene-associated FAD-dependent desaturase